MYKMKFDRIVRRSKANYPEKKLQLSIEAIGLLSNEKE
jgi:hypothetical protein